MRRSRLPFIRYVIVNLRSLVFNVSVLLTLCHFINVVITVSAKTEAT